MTVRRLVNYFLGVISIIILIIILALFVSLENNLYSQFVQIKYIKYYIFLILFLAISILIVNYYIKTRFLDPLDRLINFTDNISSKNIEEIDFDNLYKSESKAVRELVNFEKKYCSLLQELQANEEEIRSQNRSLYNSKKKIHSLTKKLEIILDSFSDIYKMNKDEFIKTSFHTVFSLIPEAEKGSVFEFNDDEYNVITSKGYDEEILKEIKFKKGDALVDILQKDIKNIEAYVDKVSNRVNECQSHKTKELLKKLGTYEDFISLYAPLVVENKVKGMISVDNFNNINYSEDSKRVLKYYAQLISEFYSQRINQQRVSRAYLEIIECMVYAMELKNSYTKGHSQRVRKYSCDIAEKLGISDERKRIVNISAILHDVGKIGIPESILTKPDRLNNREFDIIKEHPRYSKEIVEKISGLSKVAQVVYCHHEYYNGTGYPLGIKKDEIPIEAQIIQVADAYDAITTSRSYRSALSNKEAIKRIEEGIGKQFNPDIAKVAINEVFINY